MPAFGAIWGASPCVSSIGPLKLVRSVVSYTSWLHPSSNTAALFTCRQDTRGGRSNETGRSVRGLLYFMNQRQVITSSMYDLCKSSQQQRAPADFAGSVRAPCYEMHDPLLRTQQSSLLDSALLTCSPKCLIADPVQKQRGQQGFGWTPLYAGQAGARAARGLSPFPQGKTLP